MNKSIPGLRGRVGMAAIFAMLLSIAPFARADGDELTVKVNEPGVKISPMLYGLMTEEINHAYDGGLYAELIQNRSFKDPLPPPPGNRRAGGPFPMTTQPATPPAQPLHWSLVSSGEGAGTFAADTNYPVNSILTHSLRLEIAGAGENRRVGVANEGFWGIPVKPNTEYRASFYARSADLKGPLTVLIESNDGAKTHASATVAGITSEWKKYELALKTGDVEASTTNRFVISATSNGTLSLSLVSLFPPTFNNHPNGNRIDLMQLLGDMKPAFLRFPGGNYLEGDYFNERFAWKEQIGPLENRPGHQCPWRYRSSDGLGLLEFLYWCEDLKMEPVLGVFAGYALKGQRVAAGEELKPYVDEALEEIEYVIGGSETKWGAQRAKDGHPAPFKLTYVEVGNEDAFDRQRGSYDARFTQFYDAIKAKYPQLQIIATTRVETRKPDVMDDHYYRTPSAMQRDHRHYDKTDRNGPKIFVGEWATREAGGARTLTPTMNAALGDAAWMTGMERNSDIVIMSCYAPLLVNVNQGASQWQTDLIGYDALKSFGSPSYYAQKMFAQNRGDVVLPVELKTTEPAPETTAPTTGPNARPTDTLYSTASRDEASGDVIVKFVNIRATPAAVKVNLQGVESVKGASGEVLSGEPRDMNSIEEPMKVSPRPISFKDASSSFTHDFPANSVTVMRFKTK